jgi:excisionase family DNA binding protein
MDRGLLKRYLDDGLSLPQIGALVGRDPSTVGYWVQKHGLIANGRAKYAPRGGLTREQLEPLVEQRLSQREIAEQLGVSISTVRRWLKKHGLPTDAGSRRRQRLGLAAAREGLSQIAMECPRHGVAPFVRRPGDTWRCLKCRREDVAGWRRNAKRKLVEEAGGKCVICGYNRCVAALHFHHVDPSQKAFNLSRRGFTRSIDKLRAEARNCVLLCANCHAEVEAGLARLDTAA